MKKIYLVSTISATLLASCAKEELTPGEATAEKPAAVTSGKESTAALDGMMTVKFTEEMAALVEDDLAGGSLATKSMALNSAVDELGVESIERVFPDAGEYEERTRREGLHLYYKIKYRKTAAPTKALVELQAVPGVELAEPVRRVKRRAVFNDPHLGKQWHYINTNYSGKDINVEEVWKNYTTGSPDVIVSVVDGGVDLGHNDLKANAVAAGPSGSKNFVKNSYNLDVDDHGTHVAGTIAAVNNNSLGVCGIAGGNYAKNVSGCKVMSCEIFNDDVYDSDNASDATCANAIKWGADKGAVISQNSWGYYADTNDDGTVSNSELAEYKRYKISSTVKAAIDYFVKYAGCDNSGNQKAGSPMKGGVVFFASGNEDIAYDVICQQADVVAVSAFGPTGSKSYFSNYGDWVDICAPGGDGYDGNTNIYSLAPGNKYDWMAGTSMACPHVSGVAALVVSYFGGEGFSNEDLKERLIGGAVSGGVSSSSSKYIGPKLDALGAFTYGGNPPAAVSSYSASVTGNAVSFSWKVTADFSGNPCASYVLLASKSSLSGVDPAKPGSSVTTVSVTVPSGSKTGDDISGSISGLSLGTKYYVAIAAVDSDGRYSGLSTVKTLTTDSSVPDVPVVGSFSTSVNSNNITVRWSVGDNGCGAPCSSYIVLATTGDLEGVNPKNPGSGVKKVTVTVPSGSKTGDGISATLSKLSFSTSYNIAIAAVRSADSAVSLLSQVKNATTGVNNPPLIIIDASAPESIQAWQTASFPLTVTEPDGHSFSVSYANGSGADSFVASGNGSYTITLRGPGNNSGSYKATITAKDSYGAISTAEYSYTILENHAPDLVKTFDNVLSYGKGETYSFALEDYFTDRDEEVPFFKASSGNPATVFCNISAGKLYVSTLDFGTADISVTATDALGKSTSTKFTVAVRSDNSPAATYPNPVTDRLYVSTGAQEASTYVRLSSSTGATVYEKTSSFSAFSPLEINMTRCAPGRYTLEVRYDGRTTKKTVIKK